MHPIFVSIPGGVVKLLSGLLLGGGLLAAILGAVFHLRKDTPKRDRMGNYALFGVLGGLALMWFAGGRVAASVFRERWDALPIFSYGVMLGLSLVVGWYVTFYYGVRDGMPRDKMAACYFWTAVAAIAGARILYVLTNPSEFQDVSRVFALREGGLVAYGGFLGGFVGSALYARSKKMPLLSWADAAVPSLATGLLFTRVGCLLYGCDYGRPIGKHPGALAEAVAIQFPRWLDGNGAPAFNHHVQPVSEGGYGLSSSAGWSLPVYPTQILESLLGLVLFVALVVAWRRRRFTGQVFLLFVMLYAVGRYFLETLRDDPERGTVGFFSTSQAIGLLTGALALFFYLRMSKRAKENPDEAFVRFQADDAAVVTASPNPRARRRRKR